MRDHEFWENPIIQPIAELLFANSIPVMPYPTVESCLGFKPETSHMSIEEGYIVMSIDYAVKPSHKDCFFRMQEWKKELKQQQERKMKGRPPMPGMGMGAKDAMDPTKIVGEQIQKMAKKDPIVGEVLKGVQGLMKDENMQKMAKDIMKGPMKGLNDLNNQVNPMNLLGKLF